MRAKLPREVSNIAVEEFKFNFRLGGYRGDTGVVFWKKRKYMTRGKSRALLIKSGRLKRGIRAAPLPDRARVINDVPYARAHNEGFRGTVRVRAHRRGRYTVRAHKRKMNIPARPFMVTGQPLLNNIDKHIMTRLDEIWRNA